MTHDAFGANEGRVGKCRIVVCAATADGAPCEETEMPDVLVEVKGEWLRGRQSPFLAAIHAAIVEALRTPTTDKVLRLIEHPADCFLAPQACGERFTHIEITLFSGRTLETKRALYKAIVRKLEPFGVPPADVKIILIEVASSDVGMRGGQAACDVDIGYDVQV
jgi:hypothetical protein